MERETMSSDAVRIPAPREGVVTSVQRYNKDRAVIVHPRDFARLEVLDELLGEAAKLEPLAPSAEADAAHIDAETPGEPLTDLDELRRLFS